MEEKRLLYVRSEGPNYYVNNNHLPSSLSFNISTFDNLLIL